MRRATYLVGRVGTSLFVIGLALFLVYLIPSGNFSGTSTLRTEITSQKFQVGTFFTLSPTRSSHIEVQSDTSFRFLLLGTFPQDIYNWTNRWAKDNGGQPLGPPGQYTGSDNYTALQAYLAQFSSQILLDVTGTAGHNVTKDYTSGSDTNASVILANISPELMNVTFSWQITGAIAPKGITLILAEVLMPVGLLLTVPWLGQSFNARRSERLRLGK